MSAALSPFVSGTPDRVLRLTPLGLRFLDEAAQQPVTAGLKVTAVLEDHPGRPVQAQLSRSGVYVFHRLPGIETFLPPEELERRDPLTGLLLPNELGLEVFWLSQTQLRYRITVTDEWQRFLPLSLSTLAPWQLGEVSSPPVPVLLPLSSAPTRSVPVGFAGLRFQLRGSRAAFAQLGVTSPGLGRVCWGMADAGGQLLLLLPFPEPDAPASPADPSSPRTQRWRLALQGHRGYTAPVPAVPDLAVSQAARSTVATLHTLGGTPVAATLLRQGQEQPELADGSHPLGPLMIA